MEERGALFVSGEDPVEDEHMKVHVEVETAAKALHEGDRAESRSGKPRTRGPSDVAALDGLRERLHHGSQRPRIERWEVPQRERQRQYPLAHRYCREHTIHEVRRELAHASTRAAGAHASTFA